MHETEAFNNSSAHVADVLIMSASVQDVLSGLRILCSCTTIREDTSARTLRFNAMFFGGQLMVPIFCLCNSALQVCMCS